MARPTAASSPAATSISTSTATRSAGPPRTAAAGGETVMPFTLGPGGEAAVRRS
jgi:hypothetical protein